MYCAVEGTSDEKRSSLRVSAGDIDAIINQAMAVLSDPMIEALALR
jgi:hypothetical protein